MKIKCVLHKSYGGFQLTNEIIRELDDLNFEWALFGDKPDEASNDFIYTDYMNEFMFRSHPIFVQAVENLLKKLDAQNLYWLDRNKHYVSRLKIIEFNPSFEIVDYHDGHEKLYCNGREVYD